MIMISSLPCAVLPVHFLNNFISENSQHSRTEPKRNRDSFTDVYLEPVATYNLDNLSINLTILVCEHKSGLPQVRPLELLPTFSVRHCVSNDATMKVETTKDYVRSPQHNNDTKCTCNFLISFPP